MRLPNQSGIAIGPILFVIAILAVLAAAIAAGSGSFNNDTSAQANRLYASKIIETMKQVRDGIEKVSANGCRFTEVSFENSVVAGYANANSPLATRPQCHVFQPQGGGLLTVPIPPRRALLDDLLNPLLPSHCCAGEYAFWATRQMGNGVSPATHIGTSNWCGTPNPCSAELLVALPFLKREVCLEINNQLGVNNPSGNPPVFARPQYPTKWVGNNVMGTIFDANFTETTPVFSGCALDLGSYVAFMVTLYN